MPFNRTTCYVYMAMEEAQMAIINDFKYYRPSNRDDLLKLLAEYKGKASLLAGGTDLIVQMEDGTTAPDAVIDLKDIRQLSGLEFSNNRLFIGALVTFTDLIESAEIREQFPVLWESSRTVASVGIRNRATVVGNICSAVPSLDSGPPLLCLEAEVLVRDRNGQRTVPIDRWFLGPRKTDLKDTEYVEGISIKLPQKCFGGSYVKLGRYRGEDLAQAGVGVYAFDEGEYRIAFCALAPVPARAKKIESLLNGKEITDTLISEAIKLLPQELSPITDIRATKEYRLHVTGVMLERGLKAALSRRDGGGPEYGVSLL